jgi:hypothetical protein
MVREPFDLFIQTIRVQLFDGVHDPSMERAPPLL